MSCQYLLTDRLERRLAGERLAEIRSVRAIPKLAALFPTGDDDRPPAWVVHALVRIGRPGIEAAFRTLGVRVPLFLSVTIEPMGTMLAGQTVEALHASVEHVPLVSIGLNCATGPDFMTDHVRTLSEMATVAVSCMPNAGLPDEDGRYNERPESFAAKLDRFAERGWVNVVGGCCGTTPAHIEQIAKMAAAHKPRKPKEKLKPMVSGVDFLDIEETKPISKTKAWKVSKLVEKARAE